MKIEKETNKNDNIKKEMNMKISKKKQTLEYKKRHRH